MEMVSRKECPLCGQPAIHPFRCGTFSPERLQADDFRITDSRYGLRWNLDACRDCGFVFANPCPAPADLLAFYAALDDEEYGREKENRAKNFAAILRRLQRFPTPARTLLDVGAASGIFLNLARGQGYAAEGIEPSAPLVAEARRTYGLELHQGTLETYPGGQRFGVVALLDILEHVADPDAFMSQVAARTMAGGVVVAVTPDIGSLTARIAGKRWWHYRIAHIQFFNRKSLGRLLQRHGLEIVAVKRYAWNFSLHYLLSRLFPALKKEGALQKALKKINLRLQLFDSLEVYARKK